MRWIRIILTGTLGKALLKVAAPFFVPFIDKANHPLFGNSWTDDFSYYNMAIRNGAHNAFRRAQVPFSETGNTSDETMEALDGFQWRRRESLDGEYLSFRMTWGKRRDKGKREFYAGWTMRPLGFEDDTMSLTFFQFRPF